MSEKIEKSVIFLGKDFVLSDKEEEIINKCSKNEILILTYSRVEDKKVDVDRVRRNTGLKTEYKHVEPFEPLTGYIFKMNENEDLHIDVTFASPAHIMELVPFGYLPGNRVTAMQDDEMRTISNRFLDYLNLKDYLRETVEMIVDKEDGYTVKELSEKRDSKIRSDSANGPEPMPDYRKPNYVKTLNRNLKSLYEDGYVDKDKGHPARYYLNDNQRFMLKLTTIRRDDGKDGSE